MGDGLQPSGTEIFNANDDVMPRGKCVLTPVHLNEGNYEN